MEDMPLKLIAASRIGKGSVEEFINAVNHTAETFNRRRDNLVNVNEFQLKSTGYSAGRRRITARKFVHL